MAAKERRTATIDRKTSETRIAIELDLDGGDAQIDSSVDFLDHMLNAFAKHARVGLKLHARGDGMDNHHVIEDVAIALGSAIHQALGDKAGIARFGSCMVPLDEALIAASIDISGRAFCNFRVTFERADLGQLPTEMISHFFASLAENAKITLHLIQMHGNIAHHVCEASFKAFARAFAQAISPDERAGIPSTKGVIA